MNSDHCIGPSVASCGSRPSEDHASDPFAALASTPEPSTEQNANEYRKELNRAAGQRLFYARERAGWSRRGLAIALGVARSTLQNWEEAGDRHPMPRWLDHELIENAPDVAREFFRPHAERLRRAS